MTDEEKRKLDALEDKVERLEGLLLIVIREKANTARSSHRRYKNLSDQNLKQFELFDEMAGELQTASVIRKRV